MESKGIDVILGMDWLSKNKGIIDCAKKSIKLTPTKGKEIEYTAEALITPKGAVNKVILNKLDVESTDGIKVVEEFPDVFAEELPGMPPDRDIEFAIDLVPGTTPIYKRPIGWLQIN